jgi:hypothetical protein
VNAARPSDEALPEIGAYVLDGRDGRIGQVTGHGEGRVRLRPPGGGQEWECPPAELGAAGPGELLRARVREVNRRRRFR